VNLVTARNLAGVSKGPDGTFAFYGLQAERDIQGHEVLKIQECVDLIDCTRIMFSIISCKRHPWSIWTRPRLVLKGPGAVKQVLGTRGQKILFRGTAWHLAGVAKGPDATFAFYGRLQAEREIQVMSARWRPPKYTPPPGVGLEKIRKWLV